MSVGQRKFPTVVDALKRNSGRAQRRKAIENSLRVKQAKKDKKDKKADKKQQNT